jgi:hypothetical protein
MAKIHEEVIVIKLSKLVKDEQDTGTIATKDLADALSAVAEELVDTGVVVEVELA